ncbi:MAG: ABC transporter ATP-binding protein [Candidatus Rokubacteria bacterium 13_1_40CM_69_27]|nr:MAG: ABC transporter ATP-binding protein [Candidatus Rokubacteria bacterium 13_1_40CM_69_27]OLC30316.1 MAG: ABC transporter ATP-binding protein [Candidatus Rokubacteria bacterium 13_1_40CM_4_69_5]
MLEVRDLVTAYGQSLVIQGISLDVTTGEVVCLLGRNGAGKTTTLRSIMGLTPPRAGRVIFKGKEITGRQPFEIARLGVGYAPDDRRIFPDLTVEENLEIVRRVTGREGRWTVERVYQLFPLLPGLRGNRGIGLSGGEQKMLAIGRALMGNPTLLILDEPSEGLSPLMVHTLVEAIRQIRQEGVTLLLADQNLKFARRVADRGYIIEKGTIRYSGRLDDLWADQEIVRKYLAV